jgi:glycosyltransferase involved in cell wall biosynthesis
MAKPLVSVLVITYNHERYLRQALESIVAQQTDFEFEVVVGEDCSIDGTREVLLELAEHYPHIVFPILPEQNQGWLANHNTCLAQCRGEYIALLEGDDYWLSPLKLQMQVDFLRNHAECALCFTKVVKFHDDGGPTSLLPNIDVEEVTGIEDIIKRQYVQTCSVMVRRDCLQPMPSWFQGLKLGDWPLWILTAQQGKIGFIDEVTAAYRIHEGGIWSGKDPIYMCRELIRMFQRLHDHIEPQYRSLVRDAISRESFELSWLLRNEGKNNMARKAISQCVKISPLNPQLSKSRVAAMWMRYHAAPLYKMGKPFLG